ncbi:short-chain dehydrogenase [Xylanimonas oleitrophica]|uniref:Short-chain dehydrogenase n=1 Tax=Xylanimonas oleitrophica TaxID=2607479 RepID=A0A2W5WK62_9MICO|nr:SDR family NAD(P)-dependent oxidoreductase [Xylanimonas oleitrophica]PZR51969.1 short-chain dehydrogenase [Xylanimonas oleitrophica]
MTRTIVITGASDGIGAAAARRLHADGHRVVVVGRNPEKTARVAAELGARHFVADFSRLEDVRRLAADLSAVLPRIDVLANNAGGLFEEPAVTADGFERSFQVNHLAPYLLTRLLLGRLVAARGSVVWTSSKAARLWGRVDVERFADPQASGRYRPLQAYGSAKLASLLVMSELQRRYGAQGLSTVAFHPGVAASSLGSAGDGLVGRFYRSPLRGVLASPERGGEHLAALAAGEAGTDWEPAAYYENGRPARRRPAALGDEALARTVWERSEELLSAVVD